MNLAGYKIPRASSDRGHSRGLAARGSGGLSPEAHHLALILQHLETAKALILQQLEKANEVSLSANAAGLPGADSKKMGCLEAALTSDDYCTNFMLVQAQQEDDYLQIIRKGLSNSDNPYRMFSLKNQVLYKKYPNGPGPMKYVICLPDVLLPSMIDRIHHNLGHSSATATKKDFQHYYYNRIAERTIQSFVRSCVTCVRAQKSDMKTIFPSKTPLSTSPLLIKADLRRQPQEGAIGGGPQEADDPRKERMETLDKVNGCGRRVVQAQEGEGKEGRV